jgi:hypothetical protein
MIRPVDAGLCATCAFTQAVTGRRGQRYLLCRNDNVPARYPPQPVLTCSGYEPTRCDA